MTKASTESTTQTQTTKESTALSWAGKVIGALITALAIIVWTKISATQESVQQLTIQQANMVYKDSIMNLVQVRTDSVMITTLREVKIIVSDHVKDGDIHVEK